MPLGNGVIGKLTGEKSQVTHLQAKLPIINEQYRIGQAEKNVIDQAWYKGDIRKVQGKCKKSFECLKFGVPGVLKLPGVKK